MDVGGHGTSATMTRAADSPEVGGALMAEDSLVAARKHRRHPPALIGEVTVANGINPAMNAVKAAGGHAPGHAGGRQADGMQLPDRNDPVLARCNPGNEEIGTALVGFLSHV
jgi:hypothetical protein